MRRVLMVAAALGGLTTTAAWAQSKAPARWFSYIPSSQTCQVIGSPPDMARSIRTQFMSEPVFDDLLDETGKVIETWIHWDTISGHPMEAHMFRFKADCESYAATRKIATHQYD